MQNGLDKTTLCYLKRYEEILDEMIHGMKCAELTESISHNFIVQMIPHHMAAIEMSENILKYDPCPPLAEIAENIILEQTKSIENMKKALGKCSRLKNTRQDIGIYQRTFDRITQVMFRKMGEAWATNNLNADFMREMIPHHEGAVQMSENVLRFNICPELIPILRAIIKSQTEGILKMQRLLRCI